MDQDNDEQISVKEIVDHWNSYDHWNSFSRTREQEELFADLLSSKDFSTEGKV